ncbi:hypothetical protein ACH35V_17410 [Actinomadura sp. 1N219]
MTSRLTLRDPARAVVLGVSGVGGAVLEGAAGGTFRREPSARAAGAWAG